MKNNQKHRSTRKRSVAAIAQLMMACGLSLGAVSANAQTMCVFDLAGESGDIFSLMKDYALAAKQWKVDAVTLKAYKREEEAKKDFLAGKCNGLVATSFSTAQFNRYTSTISAIGAIPSNSIATTVLSLMGNPKVAANMREGEYEAVGVIPIGSAYFIMKDRSVNTLAKIEGKRIGSLAIDPIQQRMLRRLGAKPVDMTFDNGGELFKSASMDIMPAPAMAFEPLEAYRTMGESGGIAKFPMSFITLNVIVKQSDFPQGYGQASRQWFARSTAKLMDKVTNAEASVPKKYWFEVSNEDQVGYLRVLRQMRLEFVRNKSYHPKMTRLLKVLRCQQAPSNYECALKDE